MLASYAVRYPAVARAVIGVLFALLLAGILAGWQALKQAELEQSQARLQLETDALARLIETGFAHQTETLHRLARRWHQHHLRPDWWRDDAQYLLSDFQNFQAIEWLDSSYRIRWVEPLAGNEAVLGFQYPVDHPNYAILESARETNSPRLSGSFELLQGGSGLAYYVPVYRVENTPSSFDGFLLGVFRVEVLVEDLLDHQPGQRLSLDVLDRGKIIFTRHTADMQDRNWTVTSPVRLAGNASFALVAYPTGSLLASSTTLLPLMVAVIGLLAAVSLCYALWLALVNVERLAALADSNRALQSEFVRRQAIEQSLQQNQSRLKLILDMTDHSNDALFIIGLDPRELIYMNRTCWAGLGYSEEELRSLLSIAPADIMPGIIDWTEALRHLTETKGSAIYQQRVRARSGDLLPLEISVRHMERHGRDYLICVGRNNSEQLQVAARLQRLSHQDGLTGLHNRRFFDQTLASEWRKLRRQEQPLGLLMLDVDHFKAYNDTLGHQAGDEALKKLAAALKTNLLREGDCACRYGGEEFAIILPGADAKQCVKVGQRLHQALSQLDIFHPASPSGRLTISVGAASLVPMPEWGPSDLIKLADRALYQAKTEGRNRTCPAV